MSVHDVVDAGPPTGHLSMAMAYSGARGWRSGRLRTRSISRHRTDEDGDFQAEVKVELRRMVGDWEVVITGRMDGVSREGDHWVVEEIKSSALGYDRLTSLSLSDLPDAVVQLQTYLYAMANNGQPAVGRLVLMSVADGTQRVIHVPPDPEFSAFLEAQLDGSSLGGSGGSPGSLAVGVPRCPSLMATGVQVRRRWPSTSKKSRIAGFISC